MLASDIDPPKNNLETEEVDRMGNETENCFEGVDSETEGVDLEN